MGKSDEHRWAYDTFGHAELGDVRRTARLVKVASGAAARPAGTVTGVYPTSASREAAFRLLESDGVRPEAVAGAMFVATARRCVGPVVCVAVDQSSLTLGDRAKKRELGRVGDTLHQSRGLQVMTALAVAKGTPVGVLAQEWWARPALAQSTKEIRRHRWRQDPRERETGHWMRALEGCDELLATHSGARPWYQLDRGGDAWPVLRIALERGDLLTVRANHDRCVELESGRSTYLKAALESQRELGRYKLEISPQAGREARIATIALKARHVQLRPKVLKDKRVTVTMNAVLAVETRHPADGSTPLRWLLLTTHPIETFEDARRVVDAYTTRWRVEEFHRAWKSGVCNVEQTQLHSRAAIIKWASILGAVAARAVRLAYLAREKPQSPASDEFTEDEIDAAYVLSDSKRAPRTLGEVVAIIADLGGFAGKYSGKKPGPTVIARGLADVEVLARALPRLRKLR